MVLPGHIAGGYLATYALLALSPISNSGIFSSTEISILYAIGILASEGPDIDLIKYYFEERRKERREKNCTNIGGINTKKLLGISDPKRAFNISETKNTLPDFQISNIDANDMNDSNDSNNLNSNHRDNITHAPLFWLAISLIISVFGIIFDSNFIYYVGWAVLIGSWTHLLLDSIEYGIRWFWPFSSKRFCLIQLDQSEFSERLVEMHARKGTFSYHWIYIKKSYPKQWTFYAEITIVVIALIVLLK